MVLYSLNMLYTLCCDTGQVQVICPAFQL